MKILVLGKNGQVGHNLRQAVAPLGEILALGEAEANFEDLAALEKVVRDTAPGVIINAAAHTAVDQAESDRETAFRLNAEAPALLARLARESGALLAHYSTDYVFDGRKDGAYQEDDPVAPLNVYGESKLAGDRAIMESGCRHLIFRVSWVYARRGRNFPGTILKLLLAEPECRIVADQVGSPTSAEFIAAATALAIYRFLNGGETLSGLYNLVASGTVSWHGYARYLAEKALELGYPLKCRLENIHPRSTVESERPALRPANSRLSTEKFQKAFGLTPPHWSRGIDLLLEEWRLPNPQ